MFCKGLGVAIKETLSNNPSDHSQVSNPLTWLFLCGVVACAVTQMNYLNKALDIFNTSMVTPIYYVMFTTFTIIASAILFQEWSKLDAKKFLGLLCGFGIIILGVFMLHAFKDFNIGFWDLPYFQKLVAKEPSPPTGMDDLLMTRLEENNDADGNNDTKGNGNDDDDDEDDEEVDERAALQPNGRTVHL